LPGRTDNEIKNYWRTHFKKKYNSPKKQEKGKAPILKQKPAPQRQEQQPQEDYMEMTIPYADPSGEQMIKAQGTKDISSMYSTLEDQCLPMMSQDVASWLDTIREEDLYGGMWNLEDAEGDITGMDHPTTGFFLWSGFE
jgi:myb proto-oncogene protein